MTGQSGLAAAFNGITSATRVQGAEKSANSGYVGKQWSAPILLTACTIYSPSNYNYFIGSGPDSGTFALRGSNDGTTWTTLASVTRSASPADVYSFTGIPTDTEYLYHSVLISSSFGVVNVAEVTFYGS
jgi:hypothetical protein